MKNKTMIVAVLATLLVSGISFGGPRDWYRSAKTKLTNPQAGGTFWQGARKRIGAAKTWGREKLTTFGAKPTQAQIKKAEQWVKDNVSSVDGSPNRLKGMEAWKFYRAAN